VFDGVEKRVDELLKMADIAMYQAKAGGRNGVALFDRTTMDRESERFRLLGERLPKASLICIFSRRSTTPGRSRAPKLSCAGITRRWAF